MNQNDANLTKTRTVLLHDSDQGLVAVKEEGEWFETVGGETMGQGGGEAYHQTSMLRRKSKQACGRRRLSKLTQPNNFGGALGCLVAADTHVRHTYRIVSIVL